MKKGFTLVELLAILAVLGIMVILVVPQLSRNINSGKEKELEKIIGIAENAGKTYHSFYEDTYKIPIETLKNEEYIDNLEDPITGNELDGCIRVLKGNDDLLKYEYSSCDGIDVSLIVNLNGGSTTQTFQSTYTDSTKINLVDPTKANHDFEGWELVKGNSILNGKTLVMGTTETTIYTLWSRWPKLTVNLNGGSTTQTFDDYYKTGTNITLVNPTRVGYTFTGWSVSSGVLSGNNLTMGTNDITLTANWQINTYSITYTLNGGTKGTNSPASGVYGSTVTVSNPTRTGYTFNGWEVSGTGASLSGTSLTIGTSNITLTAKWTANTYTISYVMNGGTKGTNAPTSGTYGSTVTVSNPTRTGYTFNGWTVTGTGASLSGTSLKIGSSNITLTAKWTVKTVTVTFNKNDGTGSTATQTFTYGASGNKFGYNTDGSAKWGTSGQFGAWNRTGYTLLGWSESSSATSATYSTYSEVTDSWINSKYPSVTLYAVWRINTYTISYVMNGGTKGTNAPTSGKYGSTVTVSNPTRPSYTFTGWSVSGTGATISGTKLTIGSSNITLTAKWKLNNTIPSFTYSGSYQIVDDSDNIISSPSTWTGNWKIRFLTSGTLTFTELNSASNGIDVFIVGGGASGGNTGYAGRAGLCGYTSGSGGGGGGELKTVKKVSVSLTSYSIVIGNGGTGGSSTYSKNKASNGQQSHTTGTSKGGTSKAFGYSAAGGSPGSGATCVTGATCGGNGGAGGTGNGGVTGGTGGKGRTNQYGGSSGAIGGYEFGETSSKAYGVGGGGGGSHNGETGEKIYGIAAAATGAACGNGAYEGVTCHNASANTGNGGGGAGVYVNPNCYSGYTSHDGQPIYANMWVNARITPHGSGGSGIVIIRNAR